MEGRDLGGEVDRSLSGTRGREGGSLWRFLIGQLPALVGGWGHHSLGVGHAENLVTWGEYDLPHYDEFEVPRDILGSVCVARQ